MKTITQQDGFTLIEAMIAIMLLAIGILPLFAMQISSIRGNSSANNLTSASIHALNQIEQILAWEATDPRLADNENVNFVGVNGPDVADNSVIAGNFTVYWDGTQRMDPVDPLLQVGIDFQVHVVWNEAGGLKQVTMNVTKSL